MAANRRSRRLRSDDSEELGLNGGNEYSREEGSGQSIEAAVSAGSKEMPLKRAAQPSPPSPEDAGAQGSGVASPVRKSPRGGVALKAKAAIPRRVKKEDEAWDSGDASPVKDPLANDISGAGQNKRAATRKRGKNGGNEYSREEGSGQSFEAAVSAGSKEMPLKGADEPSPPSPEDAGAKGSSAASPLRKSPRGGAALKTMATTSNLVRVKKEEEAGDSGDASPAKDIADAGQNKRAATPKRGKKRSPPPRQEEERLEKLAAGPDGETAAASASQRNKKDRRTKNIKKEEQQENITEQVLAGDTSPPHDKDRHSAHAEEQQEKEAANQEEQQEKEGIPQKGQTKDTSSPREKNRDQEDEKTGAQVNGKSLQGKDAPLTEKKPAVERLWSCDDELKILKALALHAESHNGALLESSHLLANLTFDKVDANEDKLNDKIRKLRSRYHRWLSQGCPSDDHNRELFDLSESLWGQVDEDEWAEPTSRDLSVLSELYPHLSKEVKAYAETHSSGYLIMTKFMTLDDEKARNLDAMCKKQHMEAFKFELGQASLTNELLSALSSSTH